MDYSKIFLEMLQNWGQWPTHDFVPVIYKYIYIYIYIYLATNMHTQRERGWDFPRVTLISIERNINLKLSNKINK